MIYMISFLLNSTSYLMIYMFLLCVKKTNESPYVNEWTALFPEVTAQAAGPLQGGTLPSVVALPLFLVLENSSFKFSNLW